MAVLPRGTVVDKPEPEGLNQEGANVTAQSPGNQKFADEGYVIGGWSQQGYNRLKKTQPSYTDKYDRLDIERGWRSEWMMFREDIVAHMRRTSDGKEFDLGLAEIPVTDNTFCGETFCGEHSAGSILTNWRPHATLGCSRALSSVG